MADPRRPMSSTVNGRLLDRSVRHALALQRYGSGLTREVVGFLNAEVFPDLLGRLAARLERIRLRGYDSGVWTTGRYASLLDDVAAIVDDGTKEARSRLVAAARVLAKTEANWQHRAISSTVPPQVAPELGRGVDMRMVQQVVSQPIQGRVQSDWWESLSQDVQKRMQVAIGTGLAQGETVDQMVRRVRGTQARGYEDGVLQATRRQAEAIVRTTVNHVSTQAREETFKEMRDVIEGVQWVSTLDTRTTEICISRDGEVYPIGEGPRPPAHWGCRSTVVPVTKDIRAILGKKPLGDVPESTRASMDGQVADSLTYPEWLDQQPASRQDEVLGRGKARLWRAGQIDAGDLVTRTGRVLTLAELQEH